MTEFIDANKLVYNSSKKLSDYFDYAPGQAPQILSEQLLTIGGEPALAREIFDGNYYYNSSEHGVVRYIVVVVHNQTVFHFNFLERGKDQKSIISMKDWQRKAFADQILSTFKFLDQTDTSNWEIYNSPEVGDYLSPFQLTYPPSWTIKEQLISEEPKSLILTLTNTNSEIIKILQGTGGGGSCIYYDDLDYTTFEGAGEFYSSYVQLNKPALWRISQNKDKNIISRVVCEKTQKRYIDGTKIGWISIDIKSEATLQEIKSILEKIILKPTAKTKTLFD